MPPPFPPNLIFPPPGSLLPQEIRDVLSNVANPPFIEIRTSAKTRSLYSGQNGSHGECRNSTVHIFSSLGRTDSSGKWEFKLHEAVCEADLLFGRPSITATPASMEGPIFLTAGFSFGVDESELNLHVQAFKPDRQPDEAWFFWHAFVPTTVNLI